VSGLTHSLTMPHNSWHSRWYRYWVSLGGKPAEYKENFCRYVRVLLFWAPLRWFFRGNIKGVPVWFAGFIAAFLAFIGAALYLWPNVTIKALIWTGIVVGGIAVVLGLLFVSFWIYDHDPERAKTAVKWVTLPIWILPYLLVKACIRIWDRYEKQFRAFGGFVEHKLFFGVHPMAVFYMLWFGGMLAIFFYQNAVATAIVIGCIIALIVLFFVGVYVYEEIQDRRAYRPKSRSRLGRMYDGAADTAKLAYTYADSKKRGSRICPFIEFENTPAT